MAHSLRNQLASLSTFFGASRIIGNRGTQSLFPVVVPRTYRHEVVLLRQAQGCAKRLTDPCSPQPYANRRFIFLNSLANAIPQLRNPMSVPRRSAKQRQFCCVSYEQKWGRKKWTDVIRNSWTSKCEGLRRQVMKA
jgi:hypothetical protein